MDYFPSATVHGIDKNNAEVCGDRIIFHQGNVQSTDFMRNIINKIGVADLIIDDGSHIALEQLMTFKMLFSMLRAGGLYVVEDVYPIAFGDVFISHIKTLIDEMQLFTHDLGYSDKIQATTQCVAGISVFRAIIFLRRGDLRLGSR